MILVGRSKPIFIITITFLCISFIVVVLRCFVRLRLVKAFRWDDGSMMFAIALNIWFAICGIAGSVYGFGKKIDEFDCSAEIETALFSLASDNRLNYSGGGLLSQPTSRYLSLCYNASPSENFGNEPGKDTTSI
ncbi:hypothetical protein N7471_002227 [Penicillium samsonianum]|uniref:uncharacterized protein n=1 Tax=Penicillium samsonianum TaxID=1882272 RepID=UPI00254714E8|nr:uncharacterized protein N7471_002227 [Penicillium samsonianum]KAJ6142774.1 hypothetical protein N7471_002227 [Penicillium samsonianum]